MYRTVEKSGTVETKVLGEGLREHDIVAVGDELTHWASVLLGRPAREALVGNVEEAEVLLVLSDLADLGPLLLVGVHTGGVVSASVQQKNGALGSFLRENVRSEWNE